MATILLTICAYFVALLAVGKWATRASDNDAFFRGNRRSPWYMVAFGMIGASISGVTFVSVPGMVNHISMTYLQTCLGFIAGYFAVAFVLLPVYYKLQLTTIYSYLHTRLGMRAYKTGASFFLLSKLAGAAIRFYVVCMLLQRFVFDALHIPFVATVGAMVALIWLYTRRGGIKTLVFTDVFQTCCMFAALLLIIFAVTDALGMTFGEAVQAVMADSRSKVFVWDDWTSTQFFWKQFISGAFIVVVMTGLDQDMMQKNLTCKTLREAQKDMCSYGLAFVPANLLFLFLGVLLSFLAAREGIALPASGDELLPMFAATGRLGQTVLILFTVGIVAASFSSADSALTALTTTFCVDICRRPTDTRLRQRAHLAMATLFAVFILLFRVFNSTSVIDAVYILCSYTYGPLLGLFAFGLFTRRGTLDKAVPFIALLSPIVCFGVEHFAQSLWGYRFGYELLLLNGALTFAGLWCFSRRTSTPCEQP